MQIDRVEAALRLLQADIAKTHNIGKAALGGKRS